MTPASSPAAPPAPPRRRVPLRAAPLRAAPRPSGRRRTAPLRALPLGAEPFGPTAEDAVADEAPEVGAVAAGAAAPGPGPADEVGREHPVPSAGPHPDVASDDPTPDEVAPEPVAPELLTPDGTPLPPPPSPPFEATAEGWEAQLPGRLGRRVRIGVTPTGLLLGDVGVGWDEIAHATVSLGRSDDQGVNVAYELRTADGRVAKARTSALSAKHGDPHYDVADHVWEVLRTVVSPRLRPAIVDAVAAGEDVELAGLRLDRRGMAAARRPDHVVPWRQVGDPVVDRRMVVIPAGVKVVKTPLASEDSVLLLDLLPELRAAAVRGRLG